MAKNSQFPACVERREDGTYIISFTDKGFYKIVSDDIVVTSSGEPLKVDIPFPSQRRVFTISEENKGLSVQASERHIPMQGAPNLRDLGGLINSKGRQLKWGKIFRSGRLSELTEKDISYFKTLGIKKIIDFRGENEISKDPVKFYKTNDIKYIHSPVGNPADFTQLMSSFAKIPNAQEALKTVMLKGFEGLIKSATDFKPVIEAMFEDVPFLFCCTAGKDRTGLASAIVLSILDVDKETVIEDYLLSNKYTVPYFMKNISQVTALGIPESIAVVAAGVRREFLETAFDIIDKIYGSFENMIFEVFAIDRQKRNSLIEKYTYGKCCI